MSEAADAAMIEAADADGRLRDDPLTDRPVDAAAAAERERSAKAAKLAERERERILDTKPRRHTPVDSHRLPP